MITIRPYRKNGVEGGWEADISAIVRGKRIRRRLKSPRGSKQGSLRWAEQLLSRWQSGEVPVDQVENTAISLQVFCDSELFRHLEHSGVKPGTIRCYRDHARMLCEIFGKRPITSFVKGDLYEIREHMEGRATTTINTAVAYLRRILVIARERGHEDVHVPEIKPLRRKESETQIYEPHELEALLSAATLLGPQTLLFVRLGCDAGLRAGEMSALSWDDVEPGTITVRRTYDTTARVVQSPKSGRTRRVPIVRDLAEALAAMPDREGFVLTGSDHLLSYTVLRRRLRKVEAMAGLPESGRIHRLRHTFATRLMEAGVPPSIIQDLGGWSSLAMVQRYSHARPQAVAHAIHSALGPPPGTDLEPVVLTAAKERKSQ